MALVIATLTVCTQAVDKAIALELEAHVRGRASLTSAPLQVDLHVSQYMCR